MITTVSTDVRSTGWITTVHADAEPEGEDERGDEAGQYDQPWFSFSVQAM